MELMIQAFLEIINEANKVEKQEKDMYLNPIKNEIEDIINSYSCYAYYDQVKDKIMVVNNITLKMVSDIFNKQYKYIAGLGPDARLVDIKFTIDKMKISIDKIFNDYANNINLSNNQEQLNENLDSNLKKECVENNKTKDRWKTIKIKRFK